MGNAHRNTTRPATESPDTPCRRRLHKVMAQAGVASRRGCETLIATGHVAVNGQPVTTLPTWVDPSIDRVAVDGHVVAMPSPTARGKLYVIVHKPRNVVSTCRDPQGRRCVTDLVDLPGRLFPVGRLDAQSSGLILLTNDGILSNHLAHPRYEVPKEYHVSVRGRVDEQNLKNLRHGIYLAHRQRPQKGQAIAVKRASMAQVKLVGYSRDKSRGDRTNLSVKLREGQNREIRRMLARLGHKVRRLERVAIGSVTLKGLAVGQWRLLTSREVNMLHRTAGLETPTTGSHRSNTAKTAAVRPKGFATSR